MTGRTIALYEELLGIAVRADGPRSRRDRCAGAARTGRILVIKLGALGDFVQAMGPAAAIRTHHADAEITLLTTQAFAELARAAPYFDRVWIDARPGLARAVAMLQLRRRLRDGHFERVYDLQTSDRSSFYFHLMGPGARPEWSGIARGASHPHANPARDLMHTLDRQAEQLRCAGDRGPCRRPICAGPRREVCPAVRSAGPAFCCWCRAARRIGRRSAGRSRAMPRWQGMSVMRAWSRS